MKEVDDWRFITGYTPPTRHFHHFLLQGANGLANSELCYVCGRYVYIWHAGCLFPLLHQEHIDD